MIIKCIYFSLLKVGAWNDLTQDIENIVKVSVVLIFSYDPLVHLNYNYIKRYLKDGYKMMEVNIFDCI